MLYVVRHGQTDWNLEFKVQGKTDIPLNKNGMQQAQEIRDRLKDIKFTKVFSSPLLRAKKTAEIICGDKNLVQVDDRIAERDMGEYEGRNVFSFDRKYVWNYAENTNIGGVEPVKTVIDRVANFLEDFEETYKKENVLVVTHGGIYPAINVYFNGIDDVENIMTKRIGNCEVVKFDIS